MNTLADTSSRQTGWEHFPHDADVGVRGRGETMAQAFEQAASALTALVTDAEIAPRASVTVTCYGADPEMLLVDWLDAVIYEMAVRQMVFGRFSVETDGSRLTGTMWGEPVDIARHAPACEPKGATLTALDVSRNAQGIWSAGCVIDV